jgi:hypothetical protein
MAAEIAMLERDGRRLYKQAIRKPVTNTPNSGEQLSGRMKAALALLDRAMRLRLQLDRLGGSLNGKGGKQRRDEDDDQVKRYQAARPQRPS